MAFIFEEICVKVVMRMRIRNLGGSDKGRATNSRIRPPGDCGPTMAKMCQSSPYNSSVLGNGTLTIY